jgi:hypothetical protein
MNEIGGFLELELNNKGEYHSNALRLNSGRSCLLYILRAQKPSKVYVPYYCCNSILEPIQSEGCDYEFYNIDEEFEIATELLLTKNEKLLYINYYGLKTNYIELLANQYGQALIVDNTQGFFVDPIKGVDTLYSPRKFFGVSDGGYLYTDEKLNEKFEQDYSTETAIHLLGRRDKSASDYYDNYIKSEERLINQPIKLMSQLTRSILNSIDYGSAILKRERNYWFLHSNLKEFNQLRIDLNIIEGPMVYPFLYAKRGIRNSLINKRIYIAKYWSEVKKNDGCSTYTKNLVDHLIPLPIDHRYTIKDMEIVNKSIIGNIIK